MVVPGVYSWLYGGGSFAVALRPTGVFHCPQYSAAAKWALTSNPDDAAKLNIDWKNYGQYELKALGDGNFEGSQKGKPSNWRKMSFVRSFNAHELLMMGDGGGSAWNFAWENGSFEVEFRCDGYNHFICKTYPAHSHWNMEDNKILINWDKYGSTIWPHATDLPSVSNIVNFWLGEYELVLDAATGQMNGCKKGEPNNWRKAQFLRNLDSSSIDSVPSHDHSDEHVHGEHCNHW